MCCKIHHLWLNFSFWFFLWLLKQAIFFFFRICGQIHERIQKEFDRSSIYVILLGLEWMLQSPSYISIGFCWVVVILFHLSFRTIQLEAPAFLPPHVHKEKTVWLPSVQNELVCLQVLKGWNFWKIRIVWCICLWNVIDDESAMQLNASSSPGIETKSIIFGV